MDERQFIIDSFRKNFSQYVNDNIVIYGLGKNTKVVLDECREFSIVGLMDGTRTGESVWGIPVITCDMAYKIDTKAIVIIATSANVPLIYRRIAKQCDEYKIKVYDINGELLQLPKGKYKLPQLFTKLGEEDILLKIDSCDVISFDIFDTLLVRNTLQPTDVFENIQMKYSSVLPAGYDFVSARINAERELYFSTNPTIYEIYQKMASDYKLPDEIINMLIDIEVEEEKRVLHPRKEMVGILQYAKEHGRIVCCTSDMYLPSSIMKEILYHNKISGFDNVFVSCDYRKPKCDGLFQVLKEQYPNKRILHVGDNFEADIRSAGIYGIDDTFEISSIYNMAQASRFSFVLDLAKTLEERNVLGTFLSHQLNNPFLFAETDGRCKISDCYSLGYFFLEPMIRTFINWMIQNAKNDGIEILLLGSRDGWLIKRLLDIFSESETLPFMYCYFYVSRSACTLAGIENAKDIEYVASLAFDGSLEEMLAKRFLLKASDIQPRGENETDSEYLAKHVDIILRQARMYKENYIKYAERENLKGKKIGFFDFVSSGTCQLWLEKILQTQMTGYYFARNYDEYKKHLCIKSLILPKSVYEKRNKLYDNYLFLENILSSPESTLKYIDFDGKCVFEKDCRNEEQIQMLQEIHDGICDAYRRKIDEDDCMNIELLETLTDLIRPEYSLMEISFFKNNNLEDEFCNRSIDLQQVLNTNA